MSDKFTYSYTAPTEKERREIESIKRQYPEYEQKPDVSHIANDKAMVNLLSLHRRVVGFAKAISTVLAIIGTLIFGTGFSLILEWGNYAIGIPVGIAGMILLGSIVFIYRRLLNRRQRKYGAEVVALCDRLLNQDRQ